MSVSGLNRFKETPDGVPILDIRRRTKTTRSLTCERHSSPFSMVAERLPGSRCTGLHTTAFLRYSIILAHGQIHTTFTDLCVNLASPVAEGRRRQHVDWRIHGFIYQPACLQTGKGHTFADLRTTSFTVLDPCKRTNGTHFR